MIGALATIIGGGFAINLGASGTIETAEALCGILFLYMAGLLGGGMVVDRKDKELNKAIEAKLSPRKQLAKKHNEVIDFLEEKYAWERKHINSLSKYNFRSFRNKFLGLYTDNYLEYQQALEELNKQQEDTPKIRKYKRFWKIVFTVGLLLNVGSCCYTVGVMGQQTENSVTAVDNSSQTGEPTEWNAENIPMPHMTDGSRYVSNPDGVVTANTEKLLDQWLKRLDDSLQIETAMVLVNRVENGDVFRVAQDLFDRYKIGKDDRGLVVLLAYQDHKVRTHTGRALEADLTDIECSRLQQTYAIPYMKSEQPDSGMLYLTEAIYNTLKKKDLPLTWQQQLENSEDELTGLLMFLFMTLFGWVIAGWYLHQRYEGTGFRNALRANPFVEPSVTVVSGGGFGGRRGGGGFGGSFGGGGFSGGSSGGGGATSSW